MKAGTILSIIIIVLAVFGVLLVLRPRVEFVDLLLIIILAMIQIGFDISSRGRRPQAGPSAAG